MNDEVNNIQIRCIMAMRQMSELFQCAPDSTSTERLLNNCKTDPFSEKTLFSSLKKSDNNWKFVMNSLQKCMSNINENIKQLYNNNNNVSILTTWDQFSTTYKMLHILHSSIKQFQITVQKANFNDKQVMLKGFNVLQTDIFKQCTIIKEIKSQLQSELSPTNYTKGQNVKYLIHRISKQILLCYQDIFKVCHSDSENNAPGEDIVPGNLFTKKISSCISDIGNSLRIEKILPLMCKLIKHIKHAQEKISHLTAIDNSLRLLAHLTPFLNQYFQLVKIHFASSLGMHRTSCKLLSILLSIFHTLATKGFCIPPELQEEEEKSGSIKFEDIESGGLGEGEGSKDVSEDIETEDQLDDAFKEGEEKEKEENESDIKEEEKGIEMSEDFEGKTHDPEKGENTNNSEDDDDEEEDLDKKMGDVDGEDSERLEEKVWDNDSEDDENLESEDDTGGVTQNKQSELVAKDGKHKDDDFENKNDQKQEEQVQDIENDEYQGECPDPLINAPPQEPEVVEIPDDLEINDEDAKDNSMNDDVEMLDDEEAAENSNDEVDPNKDVEVSEGDNMDTTDNENKNEGDDVDNMEEPNASEPYNGEDEGDNDEENQNDTHLPTHTPTNEPQALSSEDQNKSSTDPAEGSEMDWESGAKENNQQHNEGQAESKNAYEQGNAHEGKKSSQMKKGGDNQAKKQKPKVSDDRTVDKNNTEENIKRRPIEDKQSHQPSLENDADESDETDAYEHVSKEEDGVAQAVDLATEKQAAIKLVSAEYEDDYESENEVIDISSSDEEDNTAKAKGTTSNQNQQQKAGKGGEVEDEEPMDSVDGEVIPTYTVPRGLESNLYTQHELWFSLSQKYIQEQRSKVEKDLNQFISPSEATNVSNNETAKDWEKYERGVFNLAEELCEQLRLVLEPTKMSKLKGDYRTGRRLNMRKIIPYIASQFRKDKIWLRRTKPSKRQYQIMIAVDDSASMDDNHSKQLTFETLSVLGKSLSLLEAGELGIVSFGANIELLLGFQDTYDPNNCAKIFQKLTFAQKKTNYTELLNYVTDTMIKARNSDADLTKETSQLLVILSDGRGIKSSGEMGIKEAVKRARENNVFMVFVIMDDPLNKVSVLDIRNVDFINNQPVYSSYIGEFPFPFYIILREISALPVVLGEALRQWFELVTSIER